MTLVDHLVDHLAWPSAVVTIALVFRVQLRDLLDRLRSFTAKVAGQEITGQWDSLDPSTLERTVVDEWRTLDRRTGRRRYRRHRD